MTEIAMDQPIDLSSAFFIRIINVLLMALALCGALSLLNWVVTDKLSKTQVVETSQVTAAVRERELSCLAKNVYFEAGGEPFEGKVAVAQVVMNRVNSSEFPGDVCRVVYQKNIVYEKVICQFSWFCDREVMFRPVNKANYDESMIAAKKVLLEGFTLPSLKDAKYFHGSYIDPHWNRKRVAQIGHHIFYE
jgi:spore germination cell wall hydrolase CwlJ-like protein